VETQQPQQPAFQLVFIERHKCKRTYECSTADSGDTVSLETSAKGMGVMRTGSAMHAIPSAKLDKVAVARLRDSLHCEGIDTTQWGVNGTKSVEHLFWEAYQQRGCMLMGLKISGMLKRVTRIVKIRLTAEIYGVRHVLYSRMQFLHDGQIIERKQVPLRKLTWNQMSEEQLASCDESFYAENCPHTEDLKRGAKLALQDRLGLNERWQRQHLEEDMHAYTYHTEDNVMSSGYPRLPTLYCIHQVSYNIIDPEHVNVIGLPGGQEFATTDGDFNFSQHHDDDGLPIGTQLNIWMWAREMKSPKEVQKQRPIAAGEVEAAAKLRRETELRLIKRIPLPEMTSKALREMYHRMEDGQHGPPSSGLAAAVQGQATDWAKARHIADNILNENYSLLDFSKDLSAFPELYLYMLESFPDCDDQPQSVRTVTSISSSRTVGEEYQRTVGAFFAIYWLMRISMDGKEGFAFGVDDKWNVVQHETGDKMRMFPADKRVAFLKESRWDYFEKLLLDAELLQRGDGGCLQVNQKRLISLLALTAVHDIMKMELLLPQVQEPHAPYHGYGEGDTIGDHDHALAYLMDYYPHLLPSFKDLNADEKRAVKFTQCDICFNHGWFVQAEAPPGSIFTKFREALIRDHKSQIRRPDLAFYFVHWLTDLAGAEPTPLGGCERFVVKFPLPVLNSFLRSFEFVQKIATSTETEVMEEYLKVRWVEHVPSVGPLPTGDCAVAQMRLLCMGQMNAGLVLKDFSQLLEEDREVLCTEMSRTGCLGQSYSPSIVPREVVEEPKGPAFLVYYGPAFLQNLGNDRALHKLSVLAEVYRCARELWPASMAKVASNIIIRIDTIKALSISEMHQATLNGDLWVLVKHNESEAFIELSSKKKLNRFISNMQSIQVMDFRCVNVSS